MGPSRLKKVGWIFSRSTAERDFIMSTDEVCQMAAFMEEIGEQAVTAVVELAESEEGQYVHFEAFQCSQQAAKLHKEGWFRTDVVRARRAQGGGGGIAASGDVPLRVHRAAVVGSQHMGTPLW